MKNLILDIAKDKATQRISTVAKLTPIGRLFMTVLSLQEHIPLLYRTFKWLFLVIALTVPFAVALPISLVISNIIAHMISSLAVLGSITVNTISMILGGLIVLPWLKKMFTRWLSLYTWINEQELALNDHVKASIDTAKDLAKNKVDTIFSIR